MACLYCTETRFEAVPVAELLELRYRPPSLDVVLSVLKMKGQSRIYATGRLQRSTGLLRSVLSPALPKKVEKLFKLKPSGAPLAAERKI